MQRAVFECFCWLLLGDEMWRENSMLKSDIVATDIVGRDIVRTVEDAAVGRQWRQPCSVHQN